MDLYNRPQFSRQAGAYRFDPWEAEIATMNHAASNVAGLMEGLGALIVRAVRGLVAAVQALRKAEPVEVEPVRIARPANLGEREAANRAAA